MSLPLPVSLSPSKVTQFKSCALSFKYSAIDHLPSPSTVASLKGTMVHRALQILFYDFNQGQRSIETAFECLDTAYDEMREDEEFIGLELDEAATEKFFTDSVTLIRKYYELEDPDSVHAIGTELFMSTEINGKVVRGIIDRLDLDENGDLIVIDYKTGKTPGERYEQSKMEGMNFYAFLCKDILGVIPAKVKLLYLTEPLAIVGTPSDQSVRKEERQLAAIWNTIERACDQDNFKPKPSFICNFCSYKPICPAWQN